MHAWQERTAILFKDEQMERLRNATVAVIGLGGVGAYAAEMIVRAGVEHVVLLDSDSVSESNKNRQLLALDSTIGRLKTEVMAGRLADINPDLRMDIISEYLTEENVSEVLGAFDPDYVVDAIDTLAPKIALMKYCYDNHIPSVSSMGSGAKSDMTKIRISDISKSFNCPLAYMIRKRLRKLGISKGIQVVFSEELPDRDAVVPMEDRNKKSQVGTVSYLPASFGCACAQAAISYLVSTHPQP
ncbi:MAG: tRNA threonylcarbamoyladenosine dehydratase [Bacteroidales bacterium]|nr:tRNA threonylcarbamoyladenosine dehydratase [Bacteroidales bacterium]